MTDLNFQAYKAAQSKSTQELRILAADQRGLKATAYNNFTREEVLRFYSRGLA